MKRTKQNSSKIKSGKLSYKIYRFISFESFVDIVLRKQLAFVTYDMWQDPYEGFVIKAMKTEQGRYDILQWLKKNQTSNDMPPDVLLELLDKFSKTIHLQSWTKHSETDALWRIYAHNGNAIRIETDTKKIQCVEKIDLLQVDYQAVDLTRELKSIFLSDGKMKVHKAFSWKRKAFEHEKEVRLYTNIDNNYLPDEQRSEQDTDLFLKAAKISKDKGEITEQDYNNFLEREKARSETNFHIKQISFAHVPEFIESVIVHPTAADWYVQTVEQFCNNYQVNFIGKSDLYKFVHQ